MEEPIYDPKDKIPRAKHI